VRTKGVGYGRQFEQAIRKPQTDLVIRFGEILRTDGIVSTERVLSAPIP